MIRFRFAEALWLFEHPSKEARVAGQGAKRSTVLDYLFRLLLDCDCISFSPPTKAMMVPLSRSLQYTLTAFSRFTYTAAITLRGAFQPTSHC